MKTLSAIFPIDFLQMVMKSLAFVEALSQHVNLNSPCDKHIVRRYVRKPSEEMTNAKSIDTRVKANSHKASRAVAVVPMVEGLH